MQLSALACPRAFIIFMEQKIELSELVIRPLPPSSSSLIGFGSCIVNGSLRITSIGLHISPEGGLNPLNWPTKKVGNGYVFYAQPLNEEIAELFRVAFEEEAKKCGLIGANLNQENGAEQI